MNSKMLVVAFLLGSFFSVSFAVMLKVPKISVKQQGKNHVHAFIGEGDGQEHSGRTDKYGCHAGQVPYHCH